MFFIACCYFQRLRQLRHEKKFFVIQLLHILLSAAGIIGFFLALHSLYGSWSPNRIYGGVQRETNLLELVQTLGWERFRIMFRMMFGYWLDERFGLIPYAPLYAAFFPAFLWSLKNYRFRMIPAASLFTAHFLLICWGAQMGGFSPPSRHMVVLLSVVVLPLLLVFSKWNLKQRLLFFFLEGLGWLVSIAIYTHYRLIYTDATWRNPDGGSSFWQWAGMEQSIPNLTATHPNLLLIAVWIDHSLCFLGAVNHRHKAKEQQVGKQSQQNAQRQNVCSQIWNRCAGATRFFRANHSGSAFHEQIEISKKSYAESNNAELGCS